MLMLSRSKTAFVGHFFSELQNIYCLRVPLPYIWYSRNVNRQVASEEPMEMLEMRYP